MSFKQTVAEVIEKNKGSRKETARLLGISEGYLSELLAGKKNAGHDLHEKIVKAHKGELTFDSMICPHCKKPIPQADIAAHLGSVQE
jgi:hypothetical protein